MLFYLFVFIRSNCIVKLFVKEWIVKYEIIVENGEVDFVVKKKELSKLSIRFLVFWFVCVFFVGF